MDNKTDIKILSIIILSYKSQADLGRLLPTLFNSKTQFSFEVIVVDNGSDDGTWEWLNKFKELKFNNLKLIKNINSGFSAGNNLGIRHSEGKYILLLNPDTEIMPDTLEVMVDFMENNSKAGISGCKVLNPGGKLDLACRRRFPNPWNSLLRFLRISNKSYNMLDTDENQKQEVDSVMGAFLLIRKSVIEKIGLLDEQFFMYGEDLDWCWRCKQAGFSVWYVPETHIVHYKGSASRRVPIRALKWFHEAMWIFYKKHYAQKHNVFLNMLVCVGIFMRLYLLIILNYFKKDKFVSK